QIILPLTYSYVPQFVKYVFDYILDNTGAANTLPKFVLNFFGNYEGIKAMVIVATTLVLYQLFRGILMFVNGVCRGSLSEHIAFDMRKKLYSHIQDLSYSYHNSLDTGDFIQRCTSDIDTIKSFISANMPELFYIFTSIIAGGIQMASINVNIMLVSLAGLPITVIFGIIFFKIIEKKFEEIEEYEADMTSCLEESVNGVRVVKAFAKEKYEIDKFDKKNEKFATESYRLTKKMAIYWGFSDGFVTLQYAITLGYCIYLARTGLSVGDLIVCISYISMLVYPIRNLGRIITNFGKATVAAKRVDEILVEKTEYVTNGTLTPEIKGNIEFIDVRFKFEDSDKYLLNGLSFKINQGESVAIIGKTGSGKSTIANLLVRMMEINDGQILIDGVDIRDIDKHYLRNHIGIILQDPFLYQNTIYENISIASPTSNKEDVYKAASLAQIHNDILTFDEGYDTLVGEKGVTLSGGQKQRVAISRMLLLNKEVLLFDDSLSAVDTKTDLGIRNALKEHNKELTSIIITHRITTAKECDKIIVIENGKVSAMGTHDELASIPGLYKELWDIQGALEDEFIAIATTKERSKRYV
ncbi:MAG: ABC transporter ATP-binding protein, partial [Bacilli bacterium]|nr:ABC transporter ATP-binding protein [Bacilli bacterium]